MHEHVVLKLHPSSIRGKNSAIRFHHIMAGAVDFTMQGVRYKQLLKSLVKKSPVLRKLPLSPEMLLWFHQRLEASWLDRRFMAAWAALVLGFNFLLRGAEIKAIKWEDLKIYDPDKNPYLTLCIQFSKTDQAGMGVFRSLYGNGTPLCPVECWKRYEILVDQKKKKESGVVFPKIILAF